MSWEEVKTDGGVDKWYEKAAMQRDKMVFPVLRPSGRMHRCLLVADAVM